MDVLWKEKDAGAKDIHSKIKYFNEMKIKYFMCYVILNICVSLLS